MHPQNRKERLEVAQKKSNEKKAKEFTRRRFKEAVREQETKDELANFGSGSRS